MTSTVTHLGPVEIGFIDDLVVEALSVVFPQMRDVTDKVAQLTDQSKEEIAML